jgi:hypothetical protein
VRLEQVTLDASEGGEPFALGLGGLLLAAVGRSGRGGRGGWCIRDSGEKVLLLSSAGSTGAVGGVDQLLGAIVLST